MCIDCENEHTHTQTDRQTAADTHTHINPTSMVANKHFTYLPTYTQLLDTHTHAHVYICVCVCAPKCLH